MDIKSEQIFISRLKNGNEAAYRELYNLHYALLCRYAVQWVRDAFWAETIVEDVIFHIWEMRESFEIHVPLRSYLLRAVRNSCLNYLNQSSTRYELSFSCLDTEEEDIVFTVLTENDYPLGSLLEMELEGEILAAVESLPEDCKRVFKKSRYEYKKNEEISIELNISVNTVKYHLKRALSLLRERLGKYLVGLFCFLSSFF
ncbi:MAG: RNA polymerase sigma-70 factor [Parabacteroides gordonii]|uniref:RNA polymerase sigma-70 factor n=1 Tax=Parabacteroides gordonii TaxID=574930 RepID=UPI003A858563